MHVAIRSTSDDGTVTYRLETEDQVYEGETPSVAEYEIDAPIVAFEQTAGESDWVLEVDGEPIAFGGPGAEWNDEFAYATRQQIRSYVECAIDGLLTEADVRAIVDAKLADDGGDQVEIGDGDNTDGQGGWNPISDGAWGGRRRTNVPDGTGILAVWSRSRGNLRYRVEGVGRADYYDDPNDGRLAGLPNNDDITNRDDGTFEIAGYTGNQFGDAFCIDGYVTAFEIVDGASDWELETRGDVNVLDQYDGATEGT